MTTQTANAVDLDVVERVIRDQAGDVINAVHVRRDHPTYGYTKTSIRAKAERLEGMIGLYMVLTEQSAGPTVPRLVTFLSAQREETANRVNTARDLVKGL